MAGDGVYGDELAAAGAAEGAETFPPRSVGAFVGPEFDIRPFVSQGSPVRVFHCTGQRVKGRSFDR